ncbi:MAG: PQQ-binding-like beta-propeller repeat protein, partial [Phycisphaerae bacterium]
MKRLCILPCAALLVTAVSSGRLVAADWPQLQCDPAHTGYTADQPNPPYRLLWCRDLKEPMATASQPVIAAGRMYVGTNYGNLYALDRGTGETSWTYRTGRPILGSAAFDGGTVYVNSMDHRCHAVDARTGERRWAFETGEGIWAAPVIADGKVFVAGRDGSVYALDA